MATDTGLVSSKQNTPSTGLLSQQDTGLVSSNWDPPNAITSYDFNSPVFSARLLGANAVISKLRNLNFKLTCVLFSSLTVTDLLSEF